MLFLSQKKTDFTVAIEIKLAYVYGEQEVHMSVEQPDLAKIVTLLNKRRLYKDNPSCGFATDISLTFIIEGKEFIVCPACDGCGIFKVHDTPYYFSVSEKDWEEIESILKKYGMAFPCV